MSGTKYTWTGLRAQRRMVDGLAGPRGGVSFFRLRNARVEEAVGARIFKVGDAPPTGR